MFIENELAAFLLAVFVVFALIPSIGWFAESLKLDRAERRIDRLSEDKAKLLLENVRLKNMVKFHRANEEQKEI